MRALYLSDDFIPVSFKDRPIYCRLYVDDLFVLFTSPVHLKRYQSYLNFCHVNMSFTIETEQISKISFLDTNVISENWLSRKLHC